MEKVFLEILNRGITAGWLVLAVLVLRLVFRRAPKKFFVVLWAFVGLRLVIPFSLESTLSLIPSAETVPQEALTAESPAIQSGIRPIDNAVNPVISRTLQPGSAGHAKPLQNLAAIAGIIWAAGAGIMLLYAFISWLRIRLRVRAAVHMEDRIWACDYIDTPFILGVLRPRIFLPSSLSGEDREAVIAHEKAHLARRDHLWKPLGFLLLSVFWFHPLLWAAYIMLCRDIEFACDEKVLAGLDRSGQKNYAEALLNVSVPRRMIIASPLAFGETGVKSRIRNVLRYKKARAWIAAAAVILLAVTAVCFLTDPKQPEAAPKAETASEPDEAKKEETASEPDEAKKEPGDKAADRQTEETIDNEKESRTKTAEDQQDALPAGAERALLQYLTEILMAMAGDSTRTFAPEEFASIDGYVAAKNMELRRRYYNRVFPGGADNLQTAVAVVGTPLTENGLTMVRVQCSQSYTCGGIRAADESNYTVSLKKEGESAWTCVDLVSRDRYDRLLRTGLPDLATEWVVGTNTYIKRTPAQVDEALEKCYERLGSGSADIEFQPEESGRWTKEQLKLAADAVRLHCIAHGERLQELRPAEDSEAAMLAGAAVLRPGKTIIFVGSWRSGEGNAVNDNSLYEGWAWFVNPNGAGGWVVEGEGY